MLLLRKIFLITLLSFFVIECATQREPLEVVERSELPLFQGDVEDGQLVLPVVFHIREDGSVENVQMMTTSGDPDWDAKAVEAMKQWKFAPPESGNSDGIMVRRNVRVEFLASEIINLGELVANNEAEAELLYSRLRAGISFEQLVRQASNDSSLGKSGRFLEDVNSEEYPANVSRVLINLKVGEFSQPVELDGEFIIFKRYGERMPIY